MGASDDWFEQEFATTQIMVILRGLGDVASLVAAEQAWAAGVRAVEVPIPADQDAITLERVAAAGRERGLAVGAGSVLRVEQVNLARQAGAAYVVSPGTDEEVIRAALDAGLATLPGVASATEVQRCLRLGLHWLRAFPAQSLGVGWFATMEGPFPQVRFVAAGGVKVTDAAGYLAAGARVAAIGSGLGGPAGLAALSPLIRRD